MHPIQKEVAKRPEHIADKAVTDHHLWLHVENMP
jgi:hypothetical protein